MTAALFVTYPKAGGDRFDRDYYVETHLPLVVKNWGQYGLLSAEAYFPAGAGASEAAIALLAFGSEEAIGVALGSPETPAVLADLANFTDIGPVISRGVAP
ncbi:EthD family reductase [Sphingomonas sp.]|uniref:EthD family reductase n=1 Tax=Sphingomonas sp. TaxID=28214 RepID=UPI000DB4F786|nr:EthD family reductase [Sphingomonas sp.]PZU09770.1 MAG: EthD family reductase [Sphingomonas sp.]